MSRKLFVTVVSAVQLAKKDLFGSSDPYCKVELGGTTKKTAVARRTLNPTWNETFEFPSRANNVLNVEVYDKDRFTRDDFLGKISVPIGRLFAQEGAVYDQWFWLQPRTANETVRGRIHLKMNLEARSGGGSGAAAATQSASRARGGSAAFSDVPTSDGLPEGWEAARDPQGRVYYIDHINRVTSWERPRAPRQRPQSLAREEQRQAEGQRRALQRYNSRTQNTYRGGAGGGGSSSGAAPQSLQSRQAAHTSQPLPAGWEQSRTPDGRIFFIDHNTRKTHWTDPRTVASASGGARGSGSGGGARASSRPAVAARSSGAAPNYTGDDSPLPPGWEQRQTADGKVYYVNHTNRTTQWEDPRKREGSSALGHDTAPKYKRDFRMKLNWLRAQLRVDGGIVVFEVDRKNLFEDSYRKLLRMKPEQLKSQLKVKFKGEAGLDYGGLMREWCYLLSHEMFNPYYGLFEYSAIDNYTLNINPISEQVVPDHLSYFHFIGLAVGVAIFHGQLIDAFFIRPFYKQLLGKPLTLDDVETVDPEYHRSLKWIQDNSIDDVLDLTFTMDTEVLGEKKEVELKRGGKDIEVTDENKEEYIELVIEHRFTGRVKKQMTAFKKGFHTMISPNLLQNFDEKEMELLISGLAEIDVNDWRRNTQYRNGYGDSHKVIKWFWDILETWDDEKRARLLQFTTGTSRVPLEGFAALYGSDGPMKFTIDKLSDVNKLPKAHTCFNRLDIPPYASKQVLEDKLTFALENTEGFGNK